MNRWLKWTLCGICLLILPIWVAGSVIYYKTHLDLDYCKSFIACKGGFAGIEESGEVTSIFQTDENGVLTGNIQMFSVQMDSPYLRSYDQLITDEDGTLYASVTFYSENGAVSHVISQVDFALGRLIPLWEISLEQLNGSLQSGQLFTIAGDLLYFTVYQEESNQLTTYSLGQQGELRQVNTTARLECAPERCLYTSQGLVALYRDQGVFLQEERLYPQADTSSVLVNGLGYENGVVSFLDFYQKQTVRIALDTRTEVSSEIQGQFDLSALQSVYPQSNGGFCASYEQDEKLIGVYWNGKILKNFFDLNGDVQWEVAIMPFIAALIAELLVCAIIWLLWFRKRRNRQREKRRFVSVRTRISVVSLLVTIAAVIAITCVSTYSIEEYSEQRQQISNANAAQLLLTVTTTNGTLETYDNGVLGLSKSFTAKLNEWIKKQNDLGLGYSYELFLYQNDQWYCIYSSDLTSPLAAEYAVGVKVRECFQKTMESGFIHSFEDLRSVGVQQYSMIASQTFQWDSVNYSLVAAAVTDDYTQQAVIFESVQELLQIVVATCFVLLLVENILIWLFMHRLRRLNRELSQSSVDGKWNITDFRGRDEIAETAQTMKAMTGSIEVYLKDIRTCNTQYERLIPRGAITLMGASSFTKVKAGQVSQRNVLLLTLSFSHRWDISSADRVEKGLQAVQGTEGMVLDFDDSRIVCCFMNFQQAVTALQGFLSHPDLQERFTFFLAPAQLEVGVVGDESVKRVLLLSEQGEKMHFLREHLWQEDSLGFFFGLEGTEMESHLSGFTFRLAGWLEEVPFYELIPAGENSKKQATRAVFEQALTDYREERYAQALERLQAVCRENCQDTLAASYRMDCCKRLGGELL